MKQDIRLSDDLLRHMKQLELYTRRLLKNSLMGQARSNLKGTGFEFDQIREYYMGDDVRCIDWNASARMNKLLVKQYVQERIKTVLIAVDVSSSTYSGSDAYNKWMTHADIATVLALAAGYSNDMVGLLLFSDTVERYIPPARGRHRGQFLMEVLFKHHVQKNRKTDIGALLQYAANLHKKDSMMVIISDFIDESFEPHLPALSRLYDTVVVRCLSPQERALNVGGFLVLSDIETGGEHLIDMRKTKAHRINAFLKERLEVQEKLFRQNGIDLLDVDQGTDYCADLVAFFKNRMRYV